MKDLNTLSKDQRNVTDIFEQNIRDLARTKAVLVKTEVMTEEEVAEFLDTVGQRIVDKYNRMSLDRIMLDLIMAGIEIDMKRASREWGENNEDD